MEKRFQCYWHVMHPVTFDPSKIYRIGWDDETWAAWHLIHKTRKEVLKEGFRWFYGWDWSGWSLPDYVPHNASLSWDCEDDYPSIDISEEELPEEHQAKMREWIFEAYRYRMLGETLKAQIEFLLKITYTYTQHGYRRQVDSEDTICNTPAQLLAIWPELIPFLPPEERDVMRHRHMKFQAPREWNADEQIAFHDVPGMNELTHALQTMALIPNEIDDDYPALTG